MEPSWLGYDDKLLEETIIPEGAFINSPASLAFSLDGTQLAVAYRSFLLAIWTLDPPQMIARCSRRQRQIKAHGSGAGWTGAVRVVWHPFSGHLLGIYSDGPIFKWNPMEDTHEGVKMELDATPLNIVCSPNGIVFASSDIRGTVKIYDFVHMAPIYKLTSDNDIIKAITFGSDSKRFYDLRGNYCNVWEPSCLIQLASSPGSLTSSLSDNGSVTSYDLQEKRNGMEKNSWVDLDETRSTSTTLAAMEAHADSKPAITAMSTCRDNSRLVLLAKDDGTIELQDTGRREGSQPHVLATSAYGMPVDLIALSSKGTLAAYSLFGGRLTIKGIKVSLKTGKISTKELYCEKADAGRGTIRQVSLVSRGKEKSIHLRSVTGRILDLGSINKHETADVPRISVRRLRELPSARCTVWDVHPTDLDIILAFTATCVEAYTWDDLDEPKYTFPVDLCPPSLSPSHLPEPFRIVITDVMASPAAKTHLVLVSFEESNCQVESFVILDTSPLYLDDHGSTSSRTMPAMLALPVPETVLDRIKQPVGFLADGRLVFMDEALYVCTTRPERGDVVGLSTKSHFFLPRDWLSSEGVGLCRMQPEGAFLCPSKGELAKIPRNDGMDSGTG